MTNFDILVKYLDDNDIPYEPRTTDDGDKYIVFRSSIDNGPNYRIIVSFIKNEITDIQVYTLINVKEDKQKLAELLLAFNALNAKKRFSKVSIDSELDVGVEYSFVSLDGTFSTEYAKEVVRCVFMINDVCKEVYKEYLRVIYK